MNVGQLIELLEKLPKDKEVIICDANDEEWFVEKVAERAIRFADYNLPIEEWSKKYRRITEQGYDNDWLVCELDAVIIDCK